MCSHCKTFSPSTSSPPRLLSAGRLRTPRARPAKRARAAGLGGQREASGARSGTPAARQPRSRRGPRAASSHRGASAAAISSGWTVGQADGNAAANHSANPAGWGARLTGRAQQATLSSASRRVRGEWIVTSTGSASRRCTSAVHASCSAVSEPAAKVRISHGRQRRASASAVRDRAAASRSRRRIWASRRSM